MADALHHSVPNVEDRYVLPFLYDDERWRLHGRESAPRRHIYGLEYANWLDGSKNDDPTINNEMYDKLRDAELSDAERSYPPRTRRYSFVDYRNDNQDVDQFEDTLRNERLSEDDRNEENENLYDTQLSSVNDELEYLPNEKSSDYALSNPTSPDERDEHEYEKAFSRKYKHPKTKPPRLEFLDVTGATKLDNTKSGIIGNLWSDRSDYEDEDYVDYEDGNSANKKNLTEIDELVDDDTSSKSNEMYTEGGIVRPLKHEAAPDGKFMVRIC